MTMAGSALARDRWPSSRWLDPCSITWASKTSTKTPIRPWRRRPLQEAAVRTPNQPGLGWTVVLRRQPARVVQGRVQGGYTDAYELVCCDCGDHPDLDYRDVSPERQQIRGPYSIAAGVAAYEVHVNVYHRQQSGQAVHDAGRGPACAGSDEGDD